MVRAIRTSTSPRKDPGGDERAASSLSALLEPVSVDEFLAGCWRKQHLLCRGSAARFSSLLSWTDFNRLLEHHWRETFRFRLAFRGRDLDPTCYADSGGLTPRVRPDAVTDHLRRGATLSFDGVDELHPPLRRLAESLEALFRASTKINVYAGWRMAHGLDLHRDDQEVFILQVDGRKRWLLYGPSVDGLDQHDLRSHSTPPSGAIVDEILTPGDLLYIPRGCYHVAVPLNEPTLHVTVGVKIPREMDLLLWLMERRRASGAADRDVPCLADSDDRLRYSEELRTALLAGLDADLVEQYVSETGSNVLRRPVFELPWSATPERLPPGRDFFVRSVAPAHRVDRDEDGPSIAVQNGGRTYRFPRAMQWILEPLDDGAPLPMNRLLELLTGRLDEDAVRLLVAMLVKEHLAVVTTK